MPLPIPFYLRTSQTAALTHAQLDGNLSILSTKIDNTTCNNIGNGVGIFESKEIGANEHVKLLGLTTNGLTLPRKLPKKVQRRFQTITNPSPLRSTV